MKSSADQRRKRASIRTAGWLLASGALLGCWEWSLIAARSLYGPRSIAGHAWLATLAIAFYILLAEIIMLPLKFLCHKRPQLFLPLCLLLAAASVSVISTQHPIPEKAPPRRSGADKNLILVTIDTLRRDFVGVYGNAVMKTPFLDRFAKKAALFNEVSCPAPMTTPSHASILTSTIPARHGAQDNRYRLGAQNVSLAKILNEAGYSTAAFVSCYPLARKFGLDQGFMLYDDGFEAHGGWRELAPCRFWLRWRARHELERSGSQVNEAVLPWLRTNAGRRFFLWVHYFDAHAPYKPRPPYDRFYTDQMQPSLGRPEAAAPDAIRQSCGLDSRQPVTPLLAVERYAGEISSVDHAVEELLRSLAALDLVRQTAVVITADHGESLGEHGYFYSHGASLNEPSMLVPLMFFGFDVNAAGRLNAGAVRLIDITPTSLEFFGLPMNERMEGTSLLPRLQKRSPDAPLPALIENIGIVLAPSAHKLRGVRTQGWKLVADLDAKTCDGLYNLADDPVEAVDRCNSAAEVAGSLQEYIKNGFAQSISGMVKSEAIMDEEVQDKLRQLGYIK